MPTYYEPPYLQTMTDPSDTLKAGSRPHPLASALAAFARLMSGVTVRWVDAEPSDRQRVYFANHSSHLDAVVLWASLPPAARGKTSPVAGIDYWGKTRLRRYLADNVFRALLINRQPKGAERSRAAAEAVMAQLVAAIDRGRSLIVFPEGTRGSGDEVAPFKSGIYHLARQRPQVELVPAYLENLNRILPKGEVLPVPVLSSATFGPAMHLQPGEDKDAFLARTRDAVVGLRPA
jgi:1-acyl-sn-glycerol-3-phosphate acyltransferase